MATKSKGRFENLDQILQAFDRIPARRIRMNPVPGTATEADWSRLRGKSDRLFELVDGTVVEKPMGALESYLTIELALWIRTFLQQHDLGVLYGPDNAARLMSELIRLPDLSFVSWERLPQRGKVPAEGVLSEVPNPVVEVISPSNRRGEMQRKRKEYFPAGVRHVWLVFPQSQTVRVYSDPEANVRFTAADTLTDPEILPDFALPLSQLFTRAPEARRRKK